MSQETPIPTGNLISVLNDKRFWANMAKWVAVPGGLAFAISHALHGKLADKEAANFERKIRDIVKAENPVVSLDPHLDDEDEEQRLGNLGLVGKSAETRAGIWAFKPEDKAPPASRFSADLEPGILLALAWLASSAAWKAGRRTAAKSREGIAKARERRLENVLEQSEFNRLYHANDPEGFEASLAEQERKRLTEADAVNGIVSMGRTDEAAPLLKSAASELVDRTAGTGTGERSKRDVFKDSAMRLLGLGAEGASAAATLGAKGAELVADAADKAKDTSKLMYPSVFLALALGGYGLGKTLADRTDAKRQRLKALKKILTSEMLDNQTPAILAVGSDLPWEKSKHMLGERAVAGGGIPEGVRRAAVKEAREIRI